MATNLALGPPIILGTPTATLVEMIAKSLLLGATTVLEKTAGEAASERWPFAILASQKASKGGDILEVRA